MDFPYNKAESVLSATDNDCHDMLGMIEEKLFQNFRSDGVEPFVNLLALIQEMQDVGITLSDPRLKEFNDKVQEFQDEQLNTSTASSDVTREVFHHLIKDNIELINKAISKSLVIPDFKKFCSEIKEIFNNIKPMKGGKNADYIPQLGRVDPEKWGISICTVDGQRWSCGDSKHPYTMQSTSKPFLYAMALSEYGAEKVHNHVGREPSGGLFNNISLDRESRPHNPMVNAGAIMTTSLIHPEMNVGDRFDWIETNMKKLAGEEYLSFNNSVFLSERESADRNFALAYFMREHGCYPKESYNNFKSSLELYFQQCSIEVNTESHAVMAATLANGGV